MAAALVRSCMQFSSLRQSIIDVRQDQVINQVLQILNVTCIQCQHYHISPACLKQRKTKEEKKKQQSGLAFKIPIITKKKLPEVQIWRNMTVAELAQSAQRNINDIMSALSMVDVHEHYTENTAIKNQLVLNETVKKLGAIIKHVSKSNEKEDEEKFEDVVRRPPPNESVLIRRHPVVAVMGHVDHGKTTLLDALRNTSVVQSEFGGITQHIGAFNVTLKSGERVTFLDTPGHAAFSAMRARGANVTDIVVLVVAADDGVMDQTVQSIEMAKDANVPIIVAINKIDKPQADIERTQNMLSQRGILVEKLGGDVQSVNISALKGTNLDILTDAIVLQAELMNLRGDPGGHVEGVVIECSNHPGRGKLVTTLVQRGTLKRGSVLVSGLAWAKVRAMFDHAGSPISQGTLSEAVQIIGWRDLPNVGDEMLEVTSERQAQKVLRFREAQKGDVLAKQHKEAADKKLENHLIQYKKDLALRRMVKRYGKLSKPRSRESEPDSGIPRVNVIVKGDVAGSVEAILDVLDTYNEEQKCLLSIVHYGVGNVNETDIELAETFNAIVYQFNVNVPNTLQEEAERKGVSLRLHKVIYKLVDDIKEEINGKLVPVDAEEIIGEANVLQEFEINEGKKKVKVAGCRCVSGTLKKSAMYRLMRNDEVVYTGRVVSMRHLKEEVSTIKLDVECGLRLDDPTILFKPGDTLVCFKIFKDQQKVQWNPGF